MPDRLNWSSAIGLFIINFGMLDFEVFEFLESRLQPDLFTKIKKEYFQDRITCIKTLVSGGQFSPENKQAFAKFFIRLEPLRELRNHIAHAHMLSLVVNEGDASTQSLSLPRDLDAPYSPDSRHVDLKELIGALTELTSLIEEFTRLSGCIPAVVSNLDKLHHAP
jgi:hypothetical protein